MKKKDGPAKTIGERRTARVELHPRRAALGLTMRAADRRAGPPADERHGEAGFTLVEILVVITIIGLIMGLVGPRVLNYLSESKVKAATIQIESLSGALDLYYLDLGRYPSTAQGLAALVQRPGGANAWNGPYLKNANVPNDPWAHPYIYRSPSEHGPYEIISLGSDGQEGGTGLAADIKSWEIGGTKKAEGR
ncbi:Type II secretion system protein G (modular protein) [Methylocella tundrae]|uniref:Type II secretion system core protein G n=2 Tax=Methylocella tundrae TaxID=227605 RepID=A0A8B6M8Q7_METTU|nr:Type II secretion system protein G (modular protein) [Methylocella tundrae]VTZ51407.1 Type II secretion system protein G (modular protein) [Methylocella tundrae]